ncbi:MAG: hypothetical protein ACLRI7_06675 [Ruthenibacterium lactatiformans]
MGVGLWKRACGCRSWRATCGACAFLADAALGRSGYAALGARAAAPAAHRRQRRAAVLYVVCALAQSPLLGVLACGLTGLCVSLLWPGAIILASRRILRGGGHVRAAFRGR